MSCVVGGEHRSSALIPAPHQRVRDHGFQDAHRLRRSASPTPAVRYPASEDRERNRPGWRNGSRSGLKNRSSQGRVGSIPTPGTSSFEVKR